MNPSPVTYAHATALNLRSTPARHKDMRMGTRQSIRNITTIIMLGAPTAQYRGWPPLRACD